MARRKTGWVKVISDINRAATKWRGFESKKPQKRKENYCVSKKPPRLNRHE